MVAQDRYSSLRDRIGSALRESRPAIVIEMLVMLLILALRTFRLLPTATFPFLLLGWLSLWLRRSGWRRVGLSRPVSWPRTILVGTVVGTGYQLLDIHVIVPLLHRLTGEALDLSQFLPIRGNVAYLLIWLAISWTLAALGEEMAFRGYLLNRLTDLFGHNWIGWVVSSIVCATFFGLEHVYQGITGIAVAFLFGLLFTGLYLVGQRNLWLPIIAHGVIDTVGFVLIFLGLYP
jgi:hypothetical protein